MDRRHFLALVSAGAATLLAGCAASESGAADALQATPAGQPPAPAPPSTPVLPPPPPASAKVALPGGPITAIPGVGRNLALTLDDGSDPAVVEAYVRFAEETGARFTFFVTGQYEAWTSVAPRLRPLVDSGQIQLGNHTWSHPALTSLTDSGIADELNRTKQLLLDQYGVDGTPYFRPPFGYRDARVDRVAADQGYSVPTMWYGSLSDSGLITEEYLVEMIHQYFNPQAIVIGHVNYPTATHCFPQMVDTLIERDLSMVTLDDVFLRPA